MKRMMILAFLVAAMLPQMQAQKQVTDEDFERLVKNELQMDYRAFVLKALDLSEDEIVAFDPIYRDYMNKKSKYAKEKKELMDEYAEEMKEDDSKKDEMDETGDFIENYWELKIAEMELQKDYFDKLDERITPQKAFSFFMIEDMVENRLNRPNIIKVTPMIIELDAQPNKMGMSDKDKNQKSMDNDKVAMRDKDNMDKKYMEKDKVAMKDNKNMDKDMSIIKGEANTDGKKMNAENAVNDYNNWLSKRDTKVALDHQYTHDGLTKLVSAIGTLSEAANVKDEEFNAKKQQVMKIADEIQVDPMSTKHANITRDAFVMVADMLGTIQQKSEAKMAESSVKELNMTAQKLDGDKLMTDQSTTIYKFFEEAQNTLNALSKDISYAKAKRPIED